jgi:hypothetical protein
MTTRKPGINIKFSDAPGGVVAPSRRRPRRRRARELIRFKTCELRRSWMRVSAASSRVARVSPSRRRAAEAPPATGSLQLKRSEQQQNSKRAQGRCLGLYGSTGWVCEYDEPAALCFFRRTKVGRSFLPKIM